MYICICKAVKESDLDKAIKDGITTYAEARKNLGIGTCCGKCKPEACAFINQVNDQLLAELAIPA